MAVGCHDKADPATEQSSDDEIRRRDAIALASALESDDAVDRLLQQADDMSEKGNDAAAATFLDTKALPAASDALVRAQEIKVDSSWGKEHKTRLLKLLEDRKAEVPKYSAALRSGDMDARLDVLQKQVDQEKRALDLAGEIRLARGG